MRTFGWVCAVVAVSAVLAQCSSAPCNTCPQAACPPTITLGAFCGDYQVCSGPTTAVQCDGTTVQATGNCTCAGSSGGGWSCNGVAKLTCGGDAALDGATE